MNQDLQTLKTKLSELVIKYVIDSAAEVFKQNPKLTSFSWAQFETQGDTSSKKYGTYSTRFCPTINDVPGIASVEHRLQKTVADFLSAIPIDMLTVGFGNNCTIRVANDGSYKINYDN